MDAKATAELYYNVLKTPIMKAHARQITYPISFVTNSATNNKERSIKAVIIEHLLILSILYPIIILDDIVDFCEILNINKPIPFIAIK